MSEFTKYNAVTHPIIKLEDDWNNIVDHAFEKLDDYIVRKNGSSCEVIYGGGADQAGKKAYAGSGLVDSIQWAHDHLPSGGKISVKSGYYNKEWEKTLTISNNHIDLSSVMSMAGATLGFKAKDALNADMLIVTGRKCHLHDFSLDGNKANQGAGTWRGIVAAVAGDSQLDLHLDHVYVGYTKGHGIAGCGGAGIFTGVYVEYCDGYGWYLTGSPTRNRFVGCGGYANNFNWYLESGASLNDFIGCCGDSAPNGYSGWVIMSAYNNFIACSAYYNARHGFWLYGAHHNSFDAPRCYDNSQQTNNTYDHITMSSLGGTHCTYNSIRGAIINCIAANKARYGIYEADANQDKNIIANSIVLNCVTAQILTQGVNSKEDNNIEV